MARTNQASLDWQNKLAPLRQQMENDLATVAGKPYQARPVSFHLPDFIDIIVNTGDDRFALGYTTGQSLPNWGPVSEQGRGRTVVMTNVGTDPDSLAARRSQAASLLDTASLADYVDAPEPGLFSTILHEATHNLGPAAGYTVNGQTSDLVFGGSLAAMLEELKAQTGALYFIQWLRDRGVIDSTLASRTYADSVVWALGHIAEGAGAADASPYSQLAAIQLGFLMDRGALTWDPAATAADSTDTGAFVVQTAGLVPAIDELMARVAGIAARGDRAAAQALVTRYAQGSVLPPKDISTRWARAPQASLVYAVAF